MQGVNQITIVGNATHDPEEQTLPFGAAVCDWGMAVNHAWRNRDGQKREEVCFIDCTAFGPLAALCGQVIRKGDAVLVMGRLRHETWQASDGTPRSRHKITANQVRFFGRPSDQASPGAPSSSPDREVAPDDDAPF